MPTHRRLIRWTAVLVLVPACSREAPVPAGWPALPDDGAQRAAVMTFLRQQDQQALREPDSANAVGALGNAYHANGVYEQAQSCYERAAQLAPQDWRWIYYQALLAFEQGDSDAGRNHLDAVVAAHQDYAPAWYRLAGLQAKSGEEQAAQTYQRAIEADKHSGVDRISKLRGVPPVTAYAMLSLARLAADGGDKAQARRQLEQLTKQHPDFGAAHRLLGRLAGELGDPAARFNHLGRAASLPMFAPPSDPLDDQLALSCHDVGELIRRASVAQRRGEGQLHFILAMRALELDRDDPEAMLHAAVGLKANGRVADAVKLLKKRLALQVDQFTTWMELSSCYEKANRLADSEHAFRQALAINDTNIKTRILLAMNLVSQRKLGEATSLLRQMQADNPNLTEIYGSLGVIAYLEENHEAAVAQMRRALELNPYYLGPRKMLAESLLQLGRYAEAAEVFRGTLSGIPGDRDATLGLAWLLATCPEDAVRDGKEATRLMQRQRRKDPRGLEVLAAAYAETGAFDKAAATVEQALAMLQRAPIPKLIQRLQSQRAVYRQNKPVRDSRPAP